MPEITGVFSVATFSPALSEWSKSSRFALNIFDILSSFWSLLRRAHMRFRPLSRDPFTDIGRTIPELRSVGLAESKEFHRFSVDKKNVFEIDGEAARFLFQHAPKHVDVLSCNPAAYQQHHKVFSANDSVDSAAHLSAFGSLLPFLLTDGDGKHVRRRQIVTHDLRRQTHWFPSLPGVCFPEEC